METNCELDLARFIIEKTGSNLFLTGKAGTGKTTFLRDVRKYTQKNHVVLAPTGVAAVNAGGMTIHSFFQFGFGPYVKGIFEPEPNYHIRKQKLELIRSLELIIIDEISMVRADILDHVNDALQRIRKDRRPFGGVQLLMIGDLQQLPPIASGEEAEILDGRYASYYFFDSFVLRNSYYHCIELTSVYRQTDRTFIELLNRARAGKMTPGDISMLNSRYQPHFTPGQGESYIRLVTHNSQADIINDNELALIHDKEFVFDATVSSGFPKDSLPANERLVLKRNAQVMFVRNDPDKRFVNGTIGTIDSIDNGTIFVKLSDTGEIVEVKPMIWESIRYRLDEETDTIEAEVKGTFKQYPLKTAWAITVHKSQGLTFDRAEIDVHMAFSPGQAYVALSRCRSLDGIVLNSPVRNSNFMTDGTVSEYLRVKIQDVESLACTIGYEFFDYDRPVPAEVKKTPEKVVKKKEKTSAPKVPTHEISFQMFREGKSIAEIAQERGLVQRTIFDHLTRYVASGELDVHQFISDDCIEKIAGYRRAHPDVTSLKEVFEYFDGALPYDDIRMALAYIDKE